MSSPGGRRAGPRSEAEVQNDLLRLEMYRGQLTTLSRQQELIQVSLEAHGRAREAVEAMERFEPGQEMLVSIGADTYARATPLDPGRVLIGLGRGLLAEVSRERAREMLQARMDRLEGNHRELLSQLQALEAEAQALQNELQGYLQGAERNPPTDHVGAD
jgi:prefoldin alpha subunit